MRTGRTQWELVGDILVMPLILGQRILHKENIRMWNNMATSELFPRGQKNGRLATGQRRGLCVVVGGMRGRGGGAVGNDRSGNPRLLRVPGANGTGAYFAVGRMPCDSRHPRTLAPLGWALGLACASSGF